MSAVAGYLWQDSFLKTIEKGQAFEAHQSIKGKRILILTDLFPPHFAPRIVSIARFFTQWGAECKVFTENIEKIRSKTHGQVFAQIEDPCEVYRISLRKSYDKVESLKQILWKKKDHLFAKEVDRLTQVSKCDIIIAFTFSFFPLKAAQILAEKYQKPLLVDCRDIYEQYSKNAFLPGLPEHISPFFRPLLSLLRKHLISSRNHVLRRVQAITTVSPWHQNLLSEEIKRDTPPIYCLFNGYEEKLFAPSMEKTKHFRIVFTGRILNLEMRNPSLLFDALASPELHKEVSKERIEVYWYVDEYSKQLIQEMLERYPVAVQRAQHFPPMVPFEQVAAHLAKASLILLLSNREHPSGPHGIVSTKIFEAMAMQKPILSIPGDGAISDAILKRANAGMSASTTDEITQFLIACYRSWLKNGYTCITNADRVFIQHFTRQNIARAFAWITWEVWRTTLPIPPRISQTKFRS